ncbi:hypothetical protein ACV566_09680 [Staphylococcus aureus]
MEVVEYNVTGAGYHRNYSDIEGIDGRFHNYAKEELKKVELKIRYKVPKIAYASHILNRQRPSTIYSTFLLRE